MGGATGSGAAENAAPARDAEQVAAYADDPEPAHWCWFMDGKANTSVLYEVDLDSGTWGLKRHLSDRPSNPYWVTFGNKFALHEGQLVWVHSEYIAAFDLATGALVEQERDVPSTSTIASNGSELLFGGEDGLGFYPNVAALFDSAASRAFPPDSDFIDPNFAFADAFLYGMAYVAESVNVHDAVTTGLRQRTVQLESRGANVGGFAVVDRRLFVQDGGYDSDGRGAHLATFDLDTGEHLGSLYLGASTDEEAGTIRPVGLVCGGSFQ